MDGQLRILGKWSEIEIVGNMIDIMLIANEHRITATIKKLPVEWHFKRLNGEAYTQVALDTDLLKYWPALGVRRKRQISPETRQKLIERLANLRKEKIA